MSERIELDALPARMRMLADDMHAVGAAITYYGGLGPFVQLGALLHDQSAPMLRELATAMERMQGGRA